MRGEKGREGRGHFNSHTTLYIFMHSVLHTPDNLGSCLVHLIMLSLTWSTSQTSTSPLESLVSTCCLLLAIRYSLILLPPVERDTLCKSLAHTPIPTSLSLTSFSSSSLPVPHSSLSPLSPLTHLVSSQRMCQYVRMVSVFICYKT